MSQIYSDKSRKKDPYALPDVEVFYVSDTEAKENRSVMVNECTRAFFDEEHAGNLTESGWYWWSCFPGCLPDSEAIGPFETEELAIENAQNAHEE
tara:strand:+ start:9877 stop:10161 length:285 start_codon:yes stop_codon:yes gene_type:complete